MSRSTHHTSWAAAFAVAAELSRRGFDVAFTVGNTPKYDLFCSVPNGASFKVQVKGMTNKAGFRVQSKFFSGDTEADLFLLAVYVPTDEGPVRHFVLTHKEAQQEFEKMPKKTRDGRDYVEGSIGLNWGSVTPYEGQWDKIMSALVVESQGLIANGNDST